jgi:Rieske-like [2Fe-2S] domain
VGTIPSGRLAQGWTTPDDVASPRRGYLCPFQEVVDPGWYRRGLPTERRITDPVRNIATRRLQQPFTERMALYAEHVSAQTSVRIVPGTRAGTPKVACPLHKKQFDLTDGHELNGGDLQILTFPVQVVAGEVFVELPTVVEVDAILGTNGLRVQKSDCIDIAGDAIKVPLRSASLTK